MNDYLRTLSEASNTVWTVFKTAGKLDRNPLTAFEQIRAKYKGTVAEKYVNKYTEICTDELVALQEEDAEAYMKEAYKATVEMWGKFKKYVGQLYNHELDDDDNAWNRMIYDAEQIGNKKWKPLIRNYAKRYAALCVEEVDWQYQRLNHIKDDWYKHI